MLGSRTDYKLNALLEYVEMNMYIMNGLDAWLGIKKLHNPFCFERSSNNIHNLLFLNTPLFNSIHDIPSHLPEVLGTVSAYLPI